MIIKTSAIVLKRFPFSETSLIARCFTRKHGKLSIIIRGANRKKSPLVSYFQPGNFLETLFYYKDNRDMQTLSNVSFMKNWIRFQDDLKKLTYALTVVEITDNTLSEYDPHENLFDEMTAVLSFFHEEENHYNLCFWYYELRLLCILGYEPHLKQRELPGAVLPDPGAGPNSLHVLETLKNLRIVDPSFNRILSQQTVTAKDRNVIGHYISANIEYHFETCRNLKSLKVLKQLLV